MLIIFIKTLPEGLRGCKSMELFLTNQLLLTKPAIIFIYYIFIVA